VVIIGHADQVAGTVLAQLVPVPAALLIVFVAEVMQWR
jgi:hypothetical protein